MEKLTVKAVRSDRIYSKIMMAPVEKKDDIYRYDFMKLFETKWNMLHCPLKAKQEGGVGEEDGKAMRFEGKV